VLRLVNNDTDTQTSVRIARATLPATGARAGSALADGTAEGTLTVNGKTTNVAFAYALIQPKGRGLAGIMVSASDVEGRNALVFALRNAERQCRRGIEIKMHTTVTGPAGRGAINNTVSENFFSNNTGLTPSGDYFISAAQPAGNAASNTLFNNSLTSAFGVTYSGAEIIRASGNWWGVNTEAGVGATRWIRVNTRCMASETPTNSPSMPRSPSSRCKRPVSCSREPYSVLPA
jgi:hypothetical protein